MAAGPLRTTGWSSVRRIAQRSVRCHDDRVAGTGSVGTVASLFDSVAPSYESAGVPWFVPIAERLVDEIDPHTGSRVLDAGCGRGCALPALSAAVGATGRVVGIDISPGMLRRARETVQRRDLRHVDLHLMDATAPALPPMSFSIVVSSLVLFFLPDPAAALRAWHGLLVPSGRIGVTTFAERDDTWRALDALFDPYLPPGLLDARTSGSRGPFASDAGMIDLMVAAGFERVRTVRWEQPVDLRDVEHWRTWTMSLGQRAMWEAVPALDVDALLERAVDIVGDGPFTLRQTVRLTAAERPSVMRTH